VSVNAYSFIMCLKCLREERPERGRSALNGGSYFLNFKGCGACGEMGLVKVKDRKKEETDTTEDITYIHICPSCDHEICVHTYSFKIKGRYQLYKMECDLCGEGEDESLIEPKTTEELLKETII